MKLAKETLVSPQSLVEHMILCDYNKCCKTHTIHTDLIANDQAMCSRQAKNHMQHLSSLALSTREEGGWHM